MTCFNGPIQPTAEILTWATLQPSHHPVLPDQVLAILALVHYNAMF